MDKQWLRLCLSVLAALLGWLLINFGSASTPLAEFSTSSLQNHSALAAPPAELTPSNLPTLPAGGTTPSAQPPVDLSSLGASATPILLPDTTIVIQSDFASCSPIDDGFVFARCEGGEYRFRRNDTNGTRWISFPNAYTDTVIEFDGHASSSSTTRYGVVFRLAEDGSSFYVVGLQNDGKYGVFRFDQNKYTVLIPYTASDLVAPNTGSNHIKVINQGVQIAVYLNDQWVDTVSDDGLAQGHVGFFVEGDQPGGEAAFDNLLVSTINRAIALPAPRTTSSIQPGVATATPQPSQTRAATPTPSPTEGDTTLNGNLTYDSCDPIQDDQVNARCENGEFLFTKKSQNDSQWIYYQTHYKDTIVEVDTRVVGETTSLAYGLMLRLDDDSNQAYLFLLTSAGEFGLHRYDRPDFHPLIADTSSSAIVDGTNHLKFVAQGSQLAVYVNDQFLGAVSDSQLGEGRVALYVESNEPDATVAFDNLRITQINRPISLPSTGVTAPTRQATPSTNASCPLNPGEAGVVIRNNYGAVMRFTIGGGEWRTHDFDIPGDNKWYLIRMPPGRYTYSAFIPGFGTAHGERYDYQVDVCRQISFSP